MILIILFLILILYYNKYQFKNNFININTYQKYSLENTNLPQQTYLTFLEHLKNKDFQKIDKKCVENTIKICETTNPFSYISDSKYFPAPWLIKSYQHIDYPKHVNMSCFNIFSNCCKKF